jgi:hypothetical protein
VASRVTVISVLAELISSLLLSLLTSAGSETYRTYIHINNMCFLIPLPVLHNCYIVNLFFPPLLQQVLYDGIINDIKPTRLLGRNI